MGLIGYGSKPITTEDLEELGLGGGTPELPLNLGPDKFQIDEDGTVTITPDIGSTSAAALIVEAVEDPGTNDVFLVRQSTAQGGSDILTIDDSGEVDVTVVDTSGDGVKISEAAAGGGVLLKVTGASTRAATAPIVRFITGFAPPQFSFGVGGFVLGGLNAAPDDFILDQAGSAGVGAFGFWLDPTVGATVLHIKAHDLANNVVTASIPLA